MEHSEKADGEQSGGRRSEEGQDRGELEMATRKWGTELEAK